jgi:hypothetical protein
MSITEIRASTPLSWRVPKEKEPIRTKIASTIVSAEEVVEAVASKKGPVDVICWWEGPKCLPRKGALWMKNNVLEPLYAKKREDARVHLYSLKDSWGFDKTVKQMPYSTPAGATINQLKSSQVSCMYGFDFFRYAASVPVTAPRLYSYVSKTLPEKEQLFALSKDKTGKGRSIEEFFGGSSLFDCIRERACVEGYSAMQFYEAFFLVRESVQRGLSYGQKNIQVAFVLPNDEGKYYEEFGKEISTLLQLEFGDALKEVTIDIDFYFFCYGNSQEERPYLSKTEPKLKPDQIKASFDYLSPAHLLPSRRFFRDENLND